MDGRPRVASAAISEGSKQSMGQWRGIALLALGLWMTACADALVEQFDASLHYVCPGQPVQLWWRVSGSATIEATPPLAGLANGPVEDKGHATIAPVKTTDVALHVTRFLGHPTSSTQTIRVQDDAGAPKPITASLADPGSECDAGAIRATAKAFHFADNLKVATVEPLPGDRRNYVVAHAGIQTTLAPGRVDTHFGGLPVAGDWLITTPLQPGEVCGTPTLPHNLAINVTAQCVGEGTP
jgi:hypothetical protein